jgi:hypothetical protein
MGGQQVRHEKCVDHEPRPVGGGDSRLAEGGGGEGLGPVSGLYAGQDRGISSTSFWTGAGLKKCRPRTWDGSAGGLGEPDDRDGGGAGGQDGVRTLDHPVEFPEQRSLEARVLGGGLDDQFTVGEVAESGGEGEPCLRGVAVA